MRRQLATTGSWLSSGMAWARVGALIVGPLNVRSGPRLRSQVATLYCSHLATKASTEMAHLEDGFDEGGSGLGHRTLESFMKLAGGGDAFRGHSMARGDRREAEVGAGEVEHVQCRLPRRGGHP